MNSQPAEASDRGSASIVTSGQPFDETLAFFTDELGFRLDVISPADDPSNATLSGHSLTLQVDKSLAPSPLTLRIETGVADSVVAPNGVRIDFVNPPNDNFVVPATQQELVISAASDDENWVIGRAGMRYRDLIPSRLGGRYIASHIEVCDGGPVPDSVHHHGIRFQMIFCHRGWVDVVYEDQGEPFRIQAGDCVLQPPHIRHRVLESSAGAQVVEIGCPAEHDTFFDHELELPTPSVDTERLFGGQGFVRHHSADVPWAPSSHAGFEVQQTAIEQATSGLVNVQVLRSAGETATVPTSHDGDFWFLFVLDGSTGFVIDKLDQPTRLQTGDSVAIPAGSTWHLAQASPDLALLEVVVPELD